MIDTGDPTSVTIDSSTVHKFDLLKGRQTGVHPYGGPQSGLRVNRVGRLDWLQLGAHRLEGIPDAEFDTRHNQPRSIAKKTDGVLGVGLLKNLKVVFGYSRKRIAIVTLPTKERERLRRSIAGRASLRNYPNDEVA